MPKVIVAGEPMADRLMKQISYRSAQMGQLGITPPTADQVAVVLHALADHTAIQTAQTYKPDPTSPWPEATSIGRFLHDTGDDLEVSLGL